MVAQASGKIVNVALLLNHQDETRVPSYAAAKSGVAVFLSSPAADYVTGQILPVDGGWMAR